MIEYAAESVILDDQANPLIGTLRLSGIVRAQVGNLFPREPHLCPRL